MRDGFSFWAFLLAPLVDAASSVVAGILRLCAARRRRSGIGLHVLGASRTVERRGRLAACVAGRFRSRHAAPLHAWPTRLEQCAASSSAMIAKRRSAASSIPGPMIRGLGTRRLPRRRHAAPGSRRSTAAADIVGLFPESEERRGERRHRRLRLRQSAFGGQGIRARRARKRPRPAHRGDQRSRRRSARADRVVLPGVGAFADCRRGLDAIDGMVEALDERVRRARPPVPRHLRRHAADGRARPRDTRCTEGLGWIAGEVDRIAPRDPDLKIPHMGWNTLNAAQAASAARRHRGRADRDCTPISCTRYHLQPADRADLRGRRRITAARSPPSSAATPWSAPSSIRKRASGSDWR